MTTRSITVIVNKLKEEIKDLLVRLKWSESAVATVSEDEIGNKDFLLSLTETNITTLCSITRKPGGGENGHKVLKITEDCQSSHQTGCVLGSTPIQHTPTLGPSYR